MADSGYIAPRIERDPAELAQEMYDRMGDHLPGWVPSDAHVETALIETVAPTLSELLELSSEVLAGIFRHWVGNLAQVPPIDATEATGASTWTAIDALGHTIPAGTQIAVSDGADGQVAFETTEDIEIPVASTATAAGAVEIEAVLPGAAGSGLSGAVELVDSLPWVQSITLVGSTTGGVDAETDEDYLDRASSSLRLLTRRPILPADFALLALEIAGVHRALALDGYDPTDDTEGNERMVTVAVVDDAGAVTSAPVKALVEALLESEREVNFVVHVVDPTYTSIDVDFTAVALPGFDPEAVEAAAEAALAEYLSPSNWGIPSEFGDPSGIGWIDEPTVRLSEVSEQINRVEGVHYVNTVQIRKTGGVLGTADVTLDGRVSLTEPGTITGSVS